MRKPNFFIVGAARSGTTSLWQYLKQHPAVFMPKDELEKEPSFFSNEVRTGYQTEERYFSLFGSVPEDKTWVGEASVAYLTDSMSPQKIREFDPSARIIIMLRNPAERAYSLYRWMVQDGYEYIDSFEEALLAEKERAKEESSNWYKPNYYWGYLYFRSGLYYEQVERYLKCFHSNVLVLKFEDLIDSTETCLAKVCSFMNLKPVDLLFEKYNTSREVHSARLQFKLRKLLNGIMYENRNAVPVSEISKTLMIRYQEIENKLSLKSVQSRDEAELDDKIIARVKEYLDNITDEYFFRDISNKAGRDALMEYGLKSSKPEKLNRIIRIELLKKYEGDILALTSLTGINFTSWLDL